MTEQEAHVWSRLKPLRAAGYHFRRQVPIDRYIVDFACLKKQVVVEIDGGQHGADDARDADAERDRILTSRGFRVLLFWNSAVREDIDSVIETIVARSDGRE